MRRQRRDMGERIEYPRCVTGKISYPSPGRAEHASRQIAFRYRVYACDDCGGFHITNAEKRS